MIRRMDFPGVEQVGPLGVGLWQGRLAGRDVVIRELSDAAALAPAEKLKRLDVPGLPLLIDAQSRDGRAWVDVQHG